MKYTHITIRPLNTAAPITPANIPSVSMTRPVRPNIQEVLGFLKFLSFLFAGSSMKMVSGIAKLSDRMTSIGMLQVGSTA